MTAKTSSRHILSDVQNDRALVLEAFDTGQCDGLRLALTNHDIHRKDDVDGVIENVMSTLRWFSCKVAVMSDDDQVATTADGLVLQAVLIYEHGREVEEKSATHEPPLLGGEAVVENGEATFKLRITVLSSLLRGSRFRVAITAADRPSIAEVSTSPMKTITKLRRGPANKDRGGLTPASGTKRTVEFDLGDLEELEEFGPSPTKRTVSGLWDEIHTNQQLLLELQRQQRDLFWELQSLREKSEKASLAPAIVESVIFESLT